MLINWKTYAVIAAAAFMIGGVGGGKIGFDRGFSLATKDCVKQMKQLRQACLAVETRLTLERDQARSEVGKINAANAERVLALLEELQVDQTRLNQALAETRKASRRAAEQHQVATQTLLYAREKIAHAIDECTKAGVPADVISLLNTITDTANLRDSDVSTAPDH